MGNSRAVAELIAVERWPSGVGTASTLVPVLCVRKASPKSDEDSRVMLTSQRGSCVGFECRGDHDGCNCFNFAGTTNTYLEDSGCAHCSTLRLVALPAAYRSTSFTDSTPMVGQPDSGSGFVSGRLYRPITPSIIAILQTSLPMATYSDGAPLFNHRAPRYSPMDSQLYRFEGIGGPEASARATVCEASELARGP